MAEDAATGRIVRAVSEFCIAAYNVAIVSQGKRPLWATVDFLYSTSQVALLLLPESCEAERDVMRRLCIERMMVLVADDEEHGAMMTSLFNSMCSTGFSSDAAAVTATQIYCRWLCSRGMDSMVDDAVCRAGLNVTHPHFLAQLEVLNAPTAAGPDDRKP